MKSYLLLLITLFPLIGWSQKADVIYLQNGNIFKGSIIKNTPDSTRIETFCGNTLNFSNTEITSIKQEKYSPYVTLKDKGYYNYTSFGGFWGSEKDEKTAVFSIIMEHQYQMNKTWSAGLVTGVEWYYIQVAPIGLSVKVRSPQKFNTALFASGLVGYSFPLEEMVLDYYDVYETRGGYFAGGEMGLILPSIGNASLFVALGYHFQELSYDHEDWYYDSVTQDTKYNRFSLKVGVCLH